MKVVLDQRIDVAAGDSYSFTDAHYGRYQITGPGYIQVIMAERGERRTATKQRRARGIGNEYGSNGPFRRRDWKTQFGRRANDITDHKERRNDLIFHPFCTSRRRKGDERRDKLTTTFRYGGRRSYDREERRTHDDYRHYATSPDPRIRALERRKA